MPLFLTSGIGGPITHLTARCEQPCMALQCRSLKGGYGSLTVAEYLSQKVIILDLDPALF